MAPAGKSHNCGALSRALDSETKQQGVQSMAISGQSTECGHELQGGENRCATDTGCKGIAITQQLYRLARVSARYQTR